MATNDKKGTLIIAGSGIASIGHITLETLSYIEHSDKVYYMVADPATEAFIINKSRGDCHDLTLYYDKQKPRYESYVQMSEVMLRDVRAGHSVLGILYGHPGVFVSPSHRAIAIAKQEGYLAKMLPGVSAEDYLYADLGFDPAIPGCMTQEATKLLLHNKPLDPCIHNVIWQVGAIGVSDMLFHNQQFHLLVDRLERDFGPDHEVVHYVGAVLPQSATIMDKFAISELRKQENVMKFNTTSTLYVPPRDRAPYDPTVVEALGLPRDSDSAETRFPYSNMFNSEQSSTPYGPFERAAVEHLADHVPPADRKVLHTSPAMTQFMTDLALQPSLLERYKKDPKDVAESAPGLSAIEKLALSLDNPGSVYAVMRRTPEAVANNVEPTAEEVAGGADPKAFPTLIVVIEVVVVILAK